MKQRWSRRHWLAAAMTAVLCLGLALPVAAQEEEEGDAEAARLAKELTAKLDALAKQADEISEGDEGVKNIDLQNLDWLGSHTRKIEKHHEAKGEADKVRKAKELSAAVREAQVEVDKLNEGKSSIKLVVIALEKVERVGREAAAGLVSPNN